MVSIGHYATRWELDITDVLDVELAEQLLLATAGGYVVQWSSPGRVTIDVDMGRHGTQSTGLLTAASGLLPRLGPLRRKTKRQFTAYELAAGAILPREPRGPTPAEQQPPPLAAYLRSAVDHLCAPQAALTVVHEFQVAGIFGLPSKNGGTVYGWSTTVSTGPRPVLWLWYDGLDDEVDALVHDRYWFEWSDLTDASTVRSEVKAFAASVLAGNFAPWKVGRRAGCDVPVGEGRTISSTPGRQRS